MRRVKKQDGSDAWRLLDGDRHTVLTVEPAQPTDPLPIYVAALKECRSPWATCSLTAAVRMSHCAYARKQKVNQLWRLRLIWTH